MHKIRTKKELDKVILQLKQLSAKKETELNEGIENLIKNFDPGKMFLSGVKSMFHSNTRNYHLLSAGLSIAVGVFTEKVLLKKSNFILKYGLSQVFMNLVSTLLDEKWNPELFRKIRESLSSPAQNNITQDVEEDMSTKGNEGTI